MKNISSPILLVKIDFNLLSILVRKCLIKVVSTRICTALQWKQTIMAIIPKLSELPSDFEQCQSFRENEICKTRKIHISRLPNSKKSKIHF